MISYFKSKIIVFLTYTVGNFFLHLATMATLGEESEVKAFCLYTDVTAELQLFICWRPICLSHPLVRTR